MYTTLADLFNQTVQKYPNKEALYYVQKNQRWTYAEWNDQVNRLANALIETGVNKGDRVSTYLFNTSELATALFACTKIGAVFNPINFRLSADEVAYIISDAEPKVFLFEHAVAANLKNIHSKFQDVNFWCVDPDPPSYAQFYDQKVSAATSDEPKIDVDEEDLYAIMYTSGTTGRPKGVMHRHRDMVEQSLIIISASQLTPQDRGLVTAPMFHCAELHCCFIPRVHVGGSNVIMHHFDVKQVLQLIQDEKITLFFAAPTMWNMLLQEDLSQYDLTSLRKGFYGAAPMAPALVRACQQKLNIGLLQAYGMTEMGPAVTFLLEDEQLLKAGSAGRACLNHDIRVVRPLENGPSDPDDIAGVGEVGEIVVKGPCMMIGYYNRPEATEKALYKGWYHTGDLGYVDEDGFLWIADRVDDMLISGGENIYPREVEDVLYEHPGVLDVAVLGEPDEKWGERVVAFIVKKDPAVTESDLDLFCKDSGKLADYKRPRKYYFVDQLPRNASGKIQKFLLREQLQTNVKR
ncbi:fatty-acyl-CoA synthase [Caldalkalibacillus uzonensis]|uniref:Fatty-acyl-CoA synthase n=1 Tax=Caldalkalibacillus uzonensis TaxID=353224 RepID=A0ABU0CY57_9BACI|nr:fatty acid--CoA ligase [Caldalkalibacillus uzonensis]MDQ0341080.1 fatty-acyl-CoA synthase [Caldalkalibacillus uzonensis]